MCALACDPRPTRVGQKLCITSYNFAWLGVGICEAKRSQPTVDGSWTANPRVCYSWVEFCPRFRSGFNCLDGTRPLTTFGAFGCWGRHSWLEAVSCVGGAASCFGAYCPKGEQFAVPRSRLQPYPVTKPGAEFQIACGRHGV